MKIQLVLLLLVVLFVSLPSVVFASPPLSAVQSGETSEATPKVETVQKSWKGSFYGLGVGLGGWTVKPTGHPWDALLPASPLQFKIGYGISDSTLLYGSVLGMRIFEDRWGDWLPGYLLLGMKWGRQRGGDSYWFISGGVSPENSTRVVRGGYGINVYPSIFVEAAALIEYINDEGVSGMNVVGDLTFNCYLF